MPVEAVYEGTGHLVVRETALRAPGPGEVRVRIERCGVCGSDLHCFRGHSPLPPSCPGHEMSGVVEAAGAGTARVREGDRVAVEPLVRCGGCRACAAGDYHLCSRLALCGVNLPGGMASHVVVPEYTLFALPPTVEAELGALAEPMAVSVHAARLGGVRKGSRVLVLGAGTIGLTAAVAARHLGAEHVAITARHPRQREMALALGVDEVLDPARVRPSGDKPDVAIETVGGEATTVADATLVVTRGGTVVIVGLFSKTPVFDPGVLVMKEVRLVGSMVYNRPAGGAADFDIALDAIASNAPALRAMVTHTFPLSRVQEAFETAADKTSGAVKVMLAPALDA